MRNGGVVLNGSLASRGRHHMVGKFQLGRPGPFQIIEPPSGLTDNRPFDNRNSDGKPLEQQASCSAPAGAGSAPRLELIRSKKSCSEDSLCVPHSSQREAVVSRPRLEMTEGNSSVLSPLRNFGHHGGGALPTPVATMPAARIAPVANPSHPALNTQILEAPTEPPRRRYTCVNYNTCLDLAAALNWDNFTCRGCNGEVDEKLLWRARQALKRDEVARSVCELPEIGVHNEEAPHGDGPDPSPAAKGAQNEQG